MTVFVILLIIAGYIFGVIPIARDMANAHSAMLNVLSVFVFFGGLAAAFWGIGKWVEFMEQRAEQLKMEQEKRSKQ